ncbi:MAG TPA: glutamate-5-semialdehyde dehydrogenase [Xanthobacteraceae bacterium]|nr:glutamate-5-semialdehyde dehydrogenase [Xanthobacteraceae bacterium]
MEARLESVETGGDIAQLMRGIGARARAAARVLALAAPARKSAGLRAAAADLRENSAAILRANAEDFDAARRENATAAFLDRLMLDEKRVAAMADGIDAVALVADPVGEVIASWQRPNGLKIERVRTPLGVVAVVYESRPNVTADAGALSIKAGNAVILRGGSESFRSARAIHAAMAKGLAREGLPADALQLVPTRDRAAVGFLLAGLDGMVDVVVPRGGKSLVGRVQAEARVPVFAHLEGVCHVYVHAPADLDMAKKIVLNAKMRRTGVCGAAETLLVDKRLASSHLKPLVQMLIDAGCEVRGDPETRKVDARVVPATAEDWSTEYLDAIITVGVVDGLHAAIAHIDRYGSHHTDSIITGDQKAAEIFLNEVDSAIVLHNASTQFADGGEFGFGGEIGIATGRLHARGPVGAEQLTSFKYRIHGNGQTRPG